MAITSKKAKDAKTAPSVATGLIGGWLIAREIGIRPLGGVILGVAGVYAARIWNAKTGALGATDLIAVYFGVFGLSHPLARKIGVWPSALVVTAPAAGAVVVADSRQSTQGACRQV